MANATVVITSEPPTLAITSDVGTTTSPQIASATVTLENESPQEHVSIWLPVDDGADLQRDLKGSHPNAIVSIVTHNADGVCDCSTDTHANPSSVAASLAVIKRSWGWDEIRLCLSVSTASNYAYMLVTAEMSGARQTLDRNGTANKSLDASGGSVFLN
jgi:hypothetical protein